MAGRVSRGEAWRFQSLAHELRLRVGASLAYLERYTLAPASRAVDEPWMAGRARYLATAIVHHDAATSDAAEMLQRLDAAEAVPGVPAGAGRAGTARHRSRRRSHPPEDDRGPHPRR